MFWFLKPKIEVQRFYEPVDVPIESTVGIRVRNMNVKSRRIDVRVYYQSMLLPVWNSKPDDLKHSIVLERFGIS